MFNLFIHWLYTQTLPTDATPILRIAEEIVPESVWTLILKSSVFGDRFLAPVFRRLAHNNFVDLHLTNTVGARSGVAYSRIIWGFENLPADSLLLAMMVDLQCTVWKVADDSKSEQDLMLKLPHEFLLKVMATQSEFKQQSVTAAKLRACSYHLHETDEEKQACLLRSRRK